MYETKPNQNMGLGKLAKFVLLSFPCHRRVTNLLKKTPQKLPKIVISEIKLMFGENCGSIKEVRNGISYMLVVIMV